MSGQQSTVEELRNRLRGLQQGLFSPSPTRSSNGVASGVAATGGAQGRPSMMSQLSAPASPPSVLPSAAASPVHRMQWAQSPRAQDTTASPAAADIDDAIEVRMLRKRVHDAEESASNSRAAVLQMQDCVATMQREIDTLRAAGDESKEAQQQQAATEDQLRELCSVIDDITARCDDLQRESEDAAARAEAAEAARLRFAEALKTTERARDAALSEATTLRERHARIVSEHQQRVLALDTRYRELYDAVRCLRDDAAVDAAVHVKIERFLDSFRRPLGVHDKDGASSTSASPAPAPALSPVTEDPSRPANVPESEADEIRMLRHQVAVLAAQLKANNIALREFAAAKRSRDIVPTAKSPSMPRDLFNRDSSTAGAAERASQPRPQTAFYASENAAGLGWRGAGGAPSLAVAPPSSSSSPGAAPHVPSYLPPGFVNATVAQDASASSRVRYDADEYRRFATHGSGGASASAANGGHGSGDTSGRVAYTPPSKPTSRRTYVEPMPLDTSRSPSPSITGVTIGTGPTNPYSNYARGVTTSALHLSPGRSRWGESTNRSPSSFSADL